MQSRFFVFFIVSTLLVSNYVFTAPDLKTNNYYSYVSDRLMDPASVNITKEKISRITEDPSWKINYSEFSEWINKNYPGKSTYLDFSNTPMLYYYSNKVLPAYLVQIPHTEHNEYLQKRFLDDLPNYDIPVTVFANVPNNFWDHLDGIPNTLRHYRISEYIYRNYKPAYILNHHSIWLKKDSQLLPEKEMTSISLEQMNKTGIAMKDSSSFYVNDEHGTLNYKFDSPVNYNGKKVYLDMQITSGTPIDLNFSYRSSSGVFNDKQKYFSKINPGTNEVFIMMEALEKEKDIAEIRFIFPANSEIRYSKLQILSSDEYPDHFSTQPADHSLKWIPYMWGTYDENYLKGGIAIEKPVFSGSRIINAGNTSFLNFDAVKDKENGNYIRLSARVLSGQQTDVTMGFGSKEEKNGSISFTMKGDTLFHDYLFRISSHYNWYCKENTWLQIYPVKNNIELKTADILKGD